MGRPDASHHASWILFTNLVRLYELGIESGKQWPRVRFNGHHEFALSAFPLAVSAWEAYLNESCFGSWAEMHVPASPFWQFSHLAERWSVEDRTLIVPPLLFGRGFEPGSQPFQDFKSLVKVRNSIVHFSPDDAPLKCLEQLSQRQITMPAPAGGKNAWPLEIMSSEAVRWAANTVAAMVTALLEMQPPQMRSGNATVFQVIDEERAKELYSAAGMDPDLTVNI